MFLLVEFSIEVEGRTLIFNVVEQVCMGVSLGKFELLFRMDFGVPLDNLRGIRINGLRHAFRTYLCFSIKALKLLTPLLDGPCPLTTKGRPHVQLEIAPR